MSISLAKKQLRKRATLKRSKQSMRFFKMGPGEYAEGDVFIGVTVPDVRELSKSFAYLSLKELSSLMQSKIHEERLMALLILVNQFQEGSCGEKKKIYEFYLKSMRWINNWDLVDLTAHKIVGAYLFNQDTAILTKLALSDDLWKKRVAIVASYYFIQKNRYQETLRIAKILLKDEHDLIHKAVGWMLREVGKKDQNKEEIFLKKHYRQMPRTMLRYAIERFSEKKRMKYLRGEI